MKVAAKVAAATTVMVTMSSHRRDPNNIYNTMYHNII